MDSVKKQKRSAAEFSCVEDEAGQYIYELVQAGEETLSCTGIVVGVTMTLRAVESPEFAKEIANFVLLHVEGLKKIEFVGSSRKMLYPVLLEAAMKHKWNLEVNHDGAVLRLPAQPWFISVSLTEYALLRYTSTLEGVKNPKHFSAQRGVYVLGQKMLANFQAYRDPYCDEISIEHMSREIGSEKALKTLLSNAARVWASIPGMKTIRLSTGWGDGFEKEWAYEFAEELGWTCKTKAQFEHEEEDSEPRSFAEYYLCA